MDPVSMSLFLVFCFLVGFGGSKVVKGLAGQKVKELNYDERWSDKDYVAMIHKTRKQEEENIGTILTDCECSFHSRPKPMPPQPDRVVMNRIIPDSDIKHHIIHDGIRYPWPNFVPQYAHFTPGSSDITGYTHNGHFNWTDKTSGKAMGCRVLGLPAQPHEMIVLKNNTISPNEARAIQAGDFNKRMKKSPYKGISTRVYEIEKSLQDFKSTDINYDAAVGDYKKRPSKGYS